MMTWVVFKSCIKKGFLWLKEYWQVPFLVAWTIVVYVLTRRNSDALVEVLNAKKKSYEKQVKELERIHRDEILKRDNLLKKYEDTVREVENEFEKREEKLDAQKRETIKKIIINSKGDPDAVRREIESMFDFTFVR